MKRTISIFLLSGILFPTEIPAQNYTLPFDEPSNIFFEILLYASVYSIVGSYYYEDHLHNRLTDYPCHRGNTGNYTGSEDAPEKYFRIDLENHFLFGENNTFGDQLDLKIRPFQYFYLQSDFFQTVRFNSAADYPSHSIFNVSFCYDRLRFQKFNLGWMIGLTYVGNRVRKAGFSAGFNLDWFMLKPLSIHSSVNWGIVSHEPVNNFEIQAKYHYRRCFFAGGYETLKVLSPRYHFVSAGFGIYL
jgi:hypothetical protein